MLGLFNSLRSNRLLIGERRGKIPLPSLKLCKKLLSEFISYPILILLKNDITWDEVPLEHFSLDTHVGLFFLDIRILWICRFSRICWFRQIWIFRIGRIPWHTQSLESLDCQQIGVVTACVSIHNRFSISCSSLTVPQRTVCTFSVRVSISSLKTGNWWKRLIFKKGQHFSGGKKTALSMPARKPQRKAC